MDSLTEALCRENIHIFLETYGITNDQGEKLDFKDHAYLWDIYEDFSPRQAVRKAAQIGFSTCANIKALWLAKNRGVDIIYTLPSAADIKDFVSGKTNRLISNNQIFQTWTEDKDSIEQKRVGNNVIYFKGTWTERAAIATPADVYISDETDRSKQEIVTQYQTRLQHSKHAWEWYFSNPSAPGHGVDKYWLISDQKHWFVKCGCGHEWYLTMDNIMFKGDKPYFGCVKCKKELDRHRGRWIAKHSGKDVSGYWISLLMVPGKSAEFILQKKKEMSDEQFANFVLGQPYIGKGSVLTREMLEQNLLSNVNPRNAIEIIGVDTGKGINYVIGNKHGIFYNGKCEDYAPIDAYLRQNPNAICIIDQGGDIIGPRKLREKYPSRVYLCFFRQDRKNDELITWNDEDGTVTADRNKLIQLCVDEFTELRIPLYGSKEDWHEFITEWVGMYRTREENALQVPVFMWNKAATGRCDFPFATVYWRIGMDRFMENYVTFHDPNGPIIGSRGLDIAPDNTATLRGFLPKR